MTPKFPPLWKFVEILGIALDLPQFVSRKKKKIPVRICIGSPPLTDKETDIHRTRSHPWTHAPAWTTDQVSQLQSASPRCPRVNKFWGESWWRGRQARFGISLVYPGRSRRIHSRVCSREKGNSSSSHFRCRCVSSQKPSMRWNAVPRPCSTDGWKWRRGVGWGEKPSLLLSSPFFYLCWCCLIILLSSNLSSKAAAPFWENKKKSPLN